MFPIEKKDIKIAMLGMVDGNGHPYSWSAMFNGFNKEEMASCPFPVIPVYLNKQPPETFGIENAKITHIWTDDPKDAEHVAKASLIPNIVSKPEDVIGEVDAVIVATDKGWEHVWRCEPFVEAGLPIFVDKPLADNVEDLRVFKKWVDEGANIMSSSSLRYSKEMMPFYGSTYEFGELRYIMTTMQKTWERYGIHALEHVYPIVGQGFVSVRNSGTYEKNIVHLKHKTGVDINIASIKDVTGAGTVICGNAGSTIVKCQDSYKSFKTQLEVFVKYLRTGVRPYPFEETIEMMKIIIGGIMSRDQGGKEIFLEDIIV